MSIRALTFILVPAFLALATAVAFASPDIPEPPGLWQGPMHGQTPKTVQGATVLHDGKALTSIVARDKPVLIDVSNADHKPSNMPDDMPWIPVHRSIPNATWLPGAGSGTPAADFAAAFEKRVTALTGGDKDKPIVAFCHPQRWGSYNTAKRLAGLGYRHVYWFPGGSEGWADQAGTKAVSEDLAWKASGFDKSTVAPASDSAQR